MENLEMSIETPIESKIDLSFLKDELIFMQKHLDGFQDDESYNLYYELLKTKIKFYNNNKKWRNK